MILFNKIQQSTCFTLSLQNGCNLFAKVNILSKLRNNTPIVFRIRK
jgi:hypothetical protein